MLPQERTTGLGCIPEGRSVSYQCTVSDPTNPPIGSTVWRSDALLCPGTSNRISLSHYQFTELEIPSCGPLRAKALGVNGTNYLSQLNLTGTTDLNGTTLSCLLSDLTKIGSDIITVGG